MIRMTDEKCARCDHNLATSNRHKDRLCGECQRELGSSRATSLAYREWIERGRKREIARTAKGPQPIAQPAAPIRVDLMRTEDLIAIAERASAELHRRRAEAETLLRLLTGGQKPEPVKS